MNLEVRGAAKAFGRRTVLRAVDLELDGPGVVRVEGPNGAGKSTLLRLLAGVTRPTRGRVEARGARAFVPERFRATGALRAGELVRLAGGGAALGIDDLLDRRMGSLSQGQAQRVALAAALTRPATIVILDEPFTALDADAAADLEDALTRRAAEALVIVADHEARLTPTTRITVTEGTAAIGAPTTPRVRIRTGPAATLEGATPDGDGWRLELPPDEVQTVLAQLIQAGVEIREVRSL